MASQDFVIARPPGEGQMNEAMVGVTKVLLARVQGVLHAVSATCPHYGMPLAEGLLCGTTLRCAYHHSLFELGSGKRLEPPALEGLTTYPVREEGGAAIVTLLEPASAAGS